jgi:hypothetical protein
MKKISSPRLKLSKLSKAENSFSLLLSWSQLPLLCVAPSPSLSLRRNFLSLASVVTRTPSDLIRPPASLSHARDGGGFGLPIWWWGLGYRVAGVVVVVVGGLLVDGFVLRVCGFGGGNGDGGGGGGSFGFGFGLGWKNGFGVFWVWVMGLPIWVLGLGYGVAGVVVMAVGGLLVDGFVLRVWVP